MTSTSTPDVLVVDDDPRNRKLLEEYLTGAGYEVRVAYDGRSALALAAERAPDLVLLDVMLPGLDGFQIVERMRQAGNFAPVLMLTAKGLPEDIVHGLETGADDYLAKPFDLPVLLARVRGLIRRRDWARGSGEQPECARVGEADVDFRSFELQRAGVTVHLTLLEAMLLKLLVQRRGQVVSKAEILEKVWNLSPDTETRAVDNFVMRLRRHLDDDPRSPRLLQTVRGVGYRLAEP